MISAVKAFIDKNLAFPYHFNDIQSKLQKLHPLCTQMEETNTKLSYTEAGELDGLKKVLQDAKNLVDKGRKISRWNFITRYRFVFKVEELGKNFQKQLETLQLHALRDGKETGVRVEALVATTDEIKASTQKTEAVTQKLVTMGENVAEDVKDVKKEVMDVKISTNNTEVSVGNLTEVVTDMNQTIKENFGKQDPSALFRAWTAVPELPSHLVGLDGPLNELKEKLLKDDGLSKLVLTGPAGCGKTTLASKFCRDKQVKDKFGDNIFFVTISKDPRMDLIVQQLYQQKGKKAPVFANEEGAATLLPKFLMEEGKSPLLLVLDDVLSRSEFFLSNFDLQKTNATGSLGCDYKVLVTSRSQLKGFGSAHDVQLLDNQNAMELFHHSASLGDKSSDIPESIVTQIVAYCEGFPVALKVLGLSLNGKSKEVWTARLAKWSRGSSSIFDENELLCRLKRSIDELNKETAECFLDFGLFPHNKYIPVATLFDMWSELYDLRGDDECISQLRELSSSSLANLVGGREVKMEANGYYSQHFVIQNGLLRELAIYTAKQFDEENRERQIIEILGGNYPKWWKKQKGLSMRARLLSISTDGQFSLEWPNIELPKAEVLVLIFQTRIYELPVFVDKMPELKVLVITYDVNYGSGASLSSFQLLDCLSNLKTIILEGISISSITSNPIELESVKKISLSKCHKVSEAFRDPVKISNFFPNVEVLNIDFCNLVELPDDLGSLIRLRELNITNCCDLSTLPEGTQNLVNLEVLRLRFCRDFTKFQHPIKFPSLKTLDLAYCSSIQELPKNIGEVSSLRNLDARNCPILQELPRSMSNLEQLEVVICSYKTKLLTEALSHGKNNIPMEASTLSWDDFNQ